MKIYDLKGLIDDMMAQLPLSPKEIVNEIADIVKEEVRVAMILHYFTKEESIRHGLTTQEELDTRFKDATFDK